MTKREAVSVVKSHQENSTEKAWQSFERGEKTIDELDNEICCINWETEDYLEHVHFYFFLAGGDS